MQNTIEEDGELTSELDTIVSVRADSKTLAQLRLATRKDKTATAIREAIDYFLQFGVSEMSEMSDHGQYFSVQEVHTIFLKLNIKFTERKIRRMCGKPNFPAKKLDPKAKNSPWIIPAKTIKNFLAIREGSNGSPKVTKLE